jgi:DNA (cytosine-5)-methyltransferase 1
VNDPRNGLIYEFQRFVEDFLPKAVLMENVPYLAHTTRFKRFRKRLIDLGYECSFGVLDAANYGVPQRRKRLVFVALLQQEVSLAPVSRTSRTVRTAFKNLRGDRKRRDPLHDTTSSRSDRILALIRKIPKDGGSRKDAGKAAQLECHTKFEGFFDVYGRMSWDDVAPTITSGCINPSKGRFLHPKEDRSITLREAALLQTFPARYKISLEKGKYKAAVLIGNAFPPEFARRQARALLKQMTC